MFKLSKRSLILALVIIAFLMLPLKMSETIRAHFFETWVSVYQSMVGMKESLFASSKGEEKRIQLEREIAKLKGELLLAKNQVRKKILQTEVIYRSSVNWTESLWINKGSSEIKVLSPVLSGDALIGIVDYVGKNQSRVRLLTDPKVNPSVRAEREIGGRTYLLAKGEIEGTVDKNQRSSGTIYKGSGFNYDFPDSEGPARDLRTGSAENGSEIPIVKADDFLVTTGLDGLFPKGLKVAKVVKVKPLKEGDYYYDLEAKSLAGNLNDLRWVSVIDPVGFDPEDLPKSIH